MTTPPSADPHGGDAGAARADPRFDRVEVALHWSTAALVFALVATGAALYVDQLAVFVGRRALVRDVHVVAGLLLPLPLLVALTVARTPALVADVRRLERWPRRRLRAQKFTNGQRLFAALVVGSIPVMLGTGAVMRWFAPFPLDWRTGATFVHDWWSVVLFGLVAGHSVLGARRLRSGVDPRDEGPGVEVERLSQFQDVDEGDVPFASLE